MKNDRPSVWRQTSIPFGIDSIPRNAGTIEFLNVVPQWAADGSAEPLLLVAGSGDANRALSAAANLYLSHHKCNYLALSASQFIALQVKYRAARRSSSFMDQAFSKKLWVVANLEELSGRMEDMDDLCLYLGRTLEIDNQVVLSSKLRPDQFAGIENYSTQLLTGTFKSIGYFDFEAGDKQQPISTRQ